MNQIITFIIFLLSISFQLIITAKSYQGSTNSLDNAITGEPIVECLEDRVKLTFRTEKPFGGRIFVKGMIDSHECVKTFNGNSKNAVEFEVLNGECNMRRSRKIGPDQRGVEQAVTVIISFHDTFITKVDKAYRTTCFYMETDRVVTNSVDVSALPTTDITDTAKMPICTYSVRRGSVTGAIVTYATVGEPVFHVWECDSDMFSMLVHSCFVDDGDGNSRKTIIDEHGCSTDTIILPELTYNQQNNLAYTEVNIFKFADKVTTYFQCAVSTCMISEGMCVGRTPPKCAGTNSNSRNRRALENKHIAAVIRNSPENSTIDDPFTMDLSADKIVVLDLDDSQTKKIGNLINSEKNIISALENQDKYETISAIKHNTSQLCISHNMIIILILLSSCTLSVASAILVAFFFKLKRQDSIIFTKH
ncbi:Zona pellucida domain-containing protein [Strongyloides ratti]|uniref:Zona pellucida domain-containing protein n=1 Tax=Strongyloides ratti TaxID=34506 RepID=A0A090MZ63_STRRB|nr:Zona pellucida domain-containing protein [Strongyloides ratti]CEF68384.1 Zona pellucida domain-containing protein [Strongyloides ratti]